ncbi:MAG: helicase C-terminal domain-containing protein [Halobacteriaceae archaeon]
MSATLRPFDVLSDVLGIKNPVTLAYELDFPEHNRQTFAVDTPPLFADRRDDETTQSTILATLADAITYTAGNTLAYFPSYQEAKRYYTKLDGVIEADRFLDEPETSAQAVKESFIASENAVLCTSLWGTLTEGVSFDDDAAHSVVVVGVPYPKLTDRMQAVQDAYNNEYTSEDHDVGWRYAVEIPTIRKTRQALGRVLRSPDEIGTRILLDRRYTRQSTDDMGKYSVYSTFPPGEREEFIDIQPEKLKYALYNFFSDHEAWSGDPPDL